MAPALSIGNFFIIFALVFEDDLIPAKRFQYPATNRNLLLNIQ